MPKTTRLQHGASLIEVLVALLIFTVGLLGLAAMQLSSLQSIADSSQRSQAVWVMHDFIERMRANPTGTAAEYAAAANCAALPAPMCADYYNPSTGAKVNGSQCTASQMAAFDVWETSCSYTNLANFNTVDARFNSRDFILPPAQGVILDSAAVGNAVDLSVNWLNRATNKANNQGASSDGSTSELRIER